MKKLLRNSFVFPFSANLAINYDRIAANPPVIWDDSSPFSDLCVRMKFQPAEPPKL
jgi:hypothetical protein